MNTVDIKGDMETLAEIINNDFEGEFVDDTFTSVRSNLFRDCTKLTRVKLPNCATLGANSFTNTGITEIKADDLPNVTKINNAAFGNCASLQSVTFAKPTSLTIGNNENQHIFDGCRNLNKICFPNLTKLICGNYGKFFGTCLTQILPDSFPSLTEITGSYAFRETDFTRFIVPTLTSFDSYRGINSMSTLRVLRVPNAVINYELISMESNADWSRLRLIDFKKISSIAANALRAQKLKTLIMRNADSIIPLSSATGWFVTMTPFKNGGAGVDVYVPSSLIEEYKSATNWTTLANDYGTARFHAIEGSIYEDPYYDYDIGMED